MNTNDMTAAEGADPDYWRKRAEQLEARPVNVWLVQLKGVYRQDPGGIFPTLDEAETYATELMDRSDGYHDILVEEFEIGRRCAIDPQRLDMGVRQSHMDGTVQVRPLGTTP